ncbi:MAG: septal ring lytic transglycosylase RlpA family protein [Bacteroidia bacterium]|nr:septal ring lytic transglycosylase RlpA family protein [Bacteroidia bacterium]
MRKITIFLYLVTADIYILLRSFFIGLFIIVSGYCYGQEQVGTASYYSTKFNGRKTASGERFNKDSLTAAHKTLPFGTIIKVTNLATGDTLYARVNDRIPHKKRILDLSPAGAKMLNYYNKGLTKVKIEVIKKMK